MKTIGLLLVIVSLALVQDVKAQSAKADSARVVRIARRDANSFRLKKDILQKFYTEHFPVTSDYFKPAVSGVSNAALLNDSLYVKTYRTTAFCNTINQGKLPPLHDLSAQHPFTGHPFVRRYDYLYAWLR
jgi:hypothetical protein